MDADAENVAPEVEPEEEPAPELPPPMKPIQNPAEIVQSSTATCSNSKSMSDDVEKTGRASGFNPIGRGNKEHDLAEIEQIVKEKMVSTTDLSLAVNFVLIIPYCDTGKTWAISIRNDKGWWQSQVVAGNIIGRR